MESEVEKGSKISERCSRSKIEERKKACKRLWSRAPRYRTAHEASIYNCSQVMRGVLDRLNSEGKSFEKLSDDAIKAGGEIDTVDLFLLGKV